MATMENRKIMSNLYEVRPELSVDMYTVNLIPVIVGVIGRGASQEAIDYCVGDLKEQGFEMWGISLAHYKELYGHTSDPNLCISCGQVKHVHVSL